MPQKIIGLLCKPLYAGLELWTQIFLVAELRSVEARLLIASLKGKKQVVAVPGVSY